MSEQNHPAPHMTVAVDCTGLEEFDQLLSLAAQIYRNTTDDQTRAMIEGHFKSINNENLTIALPPLLTGHECCMLMALVDEESRQQDPDSVSMYEWATIHEKLEGTARRVADPFDRMELEKRG